MIQNFKDIENSALELDEKHRAQLARRLLLSLEDYIEENVEKSWIDEIRRRENEIKSGNVKLVPSEEVIEKVRKTLSS